MTDTLLGYFDDIATEADAPKKPNGFVAALKKLGAKVLEFLKYVGAILVRAAGHAPQALAKVDKNVRPVINSVNTAVKAFLASVKSKDTSYVTNSASAVDSARKSIDEMRKAAKEAEGGKLNAASCKMAAMAVNSWMNQVKIVIKSVPEFDPEKGDGTQYKTNQFRVAQSVIALIKDAAAAFKSCSEPAKEEETADKAKEEEAKEEPEEEEAPVPAPKQRTRPAYQPKHKKLARRRRPAAAAAVDSYLYEDSLESVIADLLDDYDDDEYAEMSALESDIYAIECDLDCRFMQMGYAI